MPFKEVFFVRHAKSDWGNQDLSDLDRPLNKRGHHIAPKMASYIRDNCKLDSLELICSPAMRALTTARYFAEIFEIPKNDILIEENLYFGQAIDYLKCLMKLQNQTDTAFVFGHNPAMESIVGKLENGYLGLVPTCAVFHTILKSDDWKVEQYSDVKLLKYYFPKIVLSK